MSDSKSPPMAVDEFQARAEKALAELEALRAEAEARSARVQEELRRLRFDAVQTVRVLRALRLPVPPVLTTVSLLDPDTVGELSAESTEGGPGVIAETAGQTDVKPVGLHRETEKEKGQVPFQPPTVEKAVVGGHGALMPERTGPPSPPSPSAPERPPAEPEGARERSNRRTREAAVENRAAVLRDLVEHGPSRLGQIIERTGLPQTLVSRCLRELRDAGEVHRAGQPGARNARWVRGSAGAEETPEAPEERTPEEKRGADLLARVRDYACQLEGQESRRFTAMQAAEALRLDKAVVVTLLDLLVDRLPALENVSDPGGATVYRYQPPKSAPVNRERRTPPEREAVRDNGRTGSPVRGTGRGPTIKTGVSAMDAILGKVDAHPHGRVELTGSDHIALVNTQTNQRVIVSKTPGGGGSPDKTRKRLAAIGLAIR